MNREETLKAIEGMAKTGMCCVLASWDNNKLPYGEYDVLYRALQCVASYANDMLEEKDTKLTNIYWAYVKDGVEEFNKELKKHKDN